MIFTYKKSQSQFNWVFIILAGMVILAFFTNFTVKYIDLQNKKDNAKIVASIDNQLLSLQQSSSELQADIENMPTNYKFGCDNIEVGNFIPRQLNDKFVFGPKSVDTDLLIVYLRSWNYPFKITNFFYMSDKQPYYLIYNSDSERFVKDLDLPNRMNIQITKIIPIQKGKKIIFTKNPSGDAVQIVPRNGNWEEGYVYIENKKYPLFGLPSIYAVIFSDYYPCILDRTLEKYKEVLKVYQEKALMLTQLRNDCNYDQLYTRLKQIEGNIDKKEYDKFKDNVKLLIEQNKNLSPCPLIF
ncbi:MAG: hypothetical protein PHD81_00945 [Candidatus Nanoarchaeia archaeon]|nr:hypothetical protein [Candidatus Nanoarchaeia archaeon]MDD5587657.1 hypothetical protein [Candidatus Nanoarchaeia archaeon]